MRQLIIATKHRSAGNETVGDMWTETKTFDPLTPVAEIMVWAEKKGRGNLILTYDESNKPDQNF